MTRRSARRTTPRISWYIALPAAFALSAMAGDARLPLFDAHVHYNADAGTQLTPEQALEILDRAGVSRALVSSTPNDGTLALHAKDPDRVVPILRPYRRESDRAGWFRDPEVLAFVERELERGVYRGIGEFHLHTGEADTPVIRRIVELAVRRDIILHAHSDTPTVVDLFAIDSRVKILWAHSGMSSAPGEITRLLDRYRNLWVETSLRNGDIAPNGRLDPAWRALFLKHPDRFLVGTDTWTTSRWQDIGAESAAARRWLAELPPEVAAKIGNGNAARLFAN